MEGRKMKCLTIVIPMYNIEKYISECLESFIVQEIIGDIEVLIIDDGSKDGSSAIAAEYERLYPQLFRIIKKQNGGHGSTINRGIEEAAGKYFKVVDGDDWVAKEAFVKLVKTLKKTDADLILSNYNWVDYKTGDTKAEVDELCPQIQYEKIYLAGEVLNKTFLKMYAMTYRTSILQNMGIRLDENCFYVDTEYIIYPIPFIKTVLFLKEFVYQYRVGMPTQSMSIDNMKKRCSQHEMVLDHLIKYYHDNENCTCSKAMATVISRMVTSQYKIYLSFKENRKSDLIEMEENLKQDMPLIYNGIQHKAVSILRKTNYYIYPVISWMVRKYLR